MSSITPSLQLLVANGYGLVVDVVDFLSAAMVRTAKQLVAPGMDTG